MNVCFSRPKFDLLKFSLKTAGPTMFSELLAKNNQTSIFSFGMASEFILGFKVEFGFICFLSFFPSFSCILAFSRVVSRVGSIGGSSVSLAKRGPGIVPKTSGGHNTSYCNILFKL